MGFIKEPRTVDLQVIDKPWTEEEKREFSALLAMRKLNKGKILRVKSAVKVPRQKPSAKNTPLKRAKLA